MKRPIFLIFISLVLLAGCSRNKPYEPALSSISIVDRNGLQETISAAERLDKFENVNFLDNQPYQKVLRVYNRNPQGDVLAYVTCYHPNGQIKQYLEVANSRAFGKYQEWYLDGTLKLDANVIGGMADLNTSAEQTWLFEGCNRVWNEDSVLEAEILYEKGELEGCSTYYHRNGNVWKKMQYVKNQLEGTSEVYLENGDLLQTTEYLKDVRDGKSIRFWSPDKIALEEVYEMAKLKSGRYYDIEGKMISEIKDGSGYRVLFGKDCVSEMHQYVGGVPAGEIKIFGKGGDLIKIYHVKENMKHGEEIEYYPGLFLNGNQKPKMSVSWHEGKIQGVVKTWYDNGNLESQKEISNNTKNGLLTAWYRDGTLMMMEEYDHDKLMKGEYYKKGDKTFVSQVLAGKGTATFFDNEGNFLRKADYFQGRLKE